MEGFPRPKKVLSGLIVKSVQQITYTISTANPIDLTISPVDVDNTIVTITTNTGTTAGDGSTAVTLVNSTTVRLTKYTNTSVSSPYYITVIEYYNAKSKQTGTRLMSGITEETLTINPVNPLKCIAVTSSTLTYNSSGVHSYYQSVAYPKNSTTLGIVSGAGSTATIYWQLLEFY